MNVIEARKIIEENNLIPKISKEIINYINGNSEKLNKKILNYVSEKELKNYKDKIKKIKFKLGDYSQRNLPICVNKETQKV